MSRQPSHADRGLLLTLIELFQTTGRAQAAAAVADAVGIPQTFSPAVEGRLERTRQAGLVERAPDGLWLPTATGISAATARPPRGRASNLPSL